MPQKSVCMSMTTTAVFSGRRSPLYGHGYGSDFTYRSIGLLMHPPSADVRVSAPDRTVHERLALEAGGAWRARLRSRSLVDSPVGRSPSSASRSSVDAQLAWCARECTSRRACRDHDAQRDHVRCGVEQIVAGGDAYGLQGWAESSGAAEEQGGVEALDRVPAGEDHECHCHQALAARESFAPAAGVVQRKER